MGLDMYLFKYPRYKNATAKDVDIIATYLDWKNSENGKKYTFEEWCGHKEREVRPDFLAFYTPYYIHRYSAWDVEKRYGYSTILQQVGYWRKANQIHAWMVENAQGGVDDCGYYEVDEYQLKELLNICKKVLTTAVMVAAPVKNGYRYEDGKEIPIYEDGTQILNREEVAKLMPTTSGFFFGSTDYDSYYMDDIKNTIDIIEKVLKETDFEKEAVVYSSSW